MTAPNYFESEESLEQQAAAWLIEREEGFSPDRAAQFAQWRDADRRHAAAIARVEATLDLLGELPSLRDVLVENTSTTASDTKETRFILFGFRPAQWIASAAAVAVLGMILWHSLPSGKQRPHDYVADVNGSQRLALSDGSIVDLKSNSRLRVQFLPERRQATLTTGEAHFQVAHDSKHPFVVWANGVSIRAVGTAFDVRIENGNVDVLVTEGKVVVERESNISRANPAKPLVPMLSAGEHTVVDLKNNTPPKIEKVAPTAVHGLLSWQDEMTTFTDVPLREMIVRINRCNSTHIILGDPELGERKIGGVIALNQVNAFVRLLEQDGDIVADRRSNEEIVLHRAR